MEPLHPAQLDGFLRRVHSARDAALRAVDLTFARGRVASVTFTLAVRDADRDDADAELRLQVGEVSELRLQVRPTQDPTALPDGLRVGVFGGQFYLDLQPWADDPSGAHDFRVSSCYAAGAHLRWELSAAAV
jgi:hypothetical protein